MQSEPEPSLPFDESATGSAGVFDMASLVGSLREAARDSELLGVSHARKLYRAELDEVQVRFPGDSRFPLLRLMWKRMLQDFPVRASDERRILSVGFTGGARTVFTEVAIQYPHQTSGGTVGAVAAAALQ
uniref:Uncharacterized protein n=1 Tax=Rhodosorus marinus TaxID=101924 RepID=A0A7S2ZTB3_9RHOD|mmetsp:Transcript_29872/g.114673  ORF Transcript_29872/g.114673 Transcript_29872/m.114673 type:complete len:130 (+) Transcript_29872:117-506(+)